MRGPGWLPGAGRRGAGAGPAAIRSALASLAVHDEVARADAGTVRTEDPNLEGAQRELSDAVRDLSLIHI